MKIIKRLYCNFFGHNDCFEREGYFKYRFRCKRCGRIIYDEPVDKEADARYHALVSGGWRKFL